MAAKRSVLITGCSEGGLGDALSRAFHERGFRVFATARNPQKMAHFKGLGIETVVLDVQSKESIDAAVRQVSQLTGGKLDVLVNNSGIGYMIPIADADVSRVREMFEVNVLSNISVSQAFLPLLMEGAPGSMIVNNTSIASILTMPMNGIYSASKAAMASISNTMRLELEPFGIKVIELKTGSVKSRFFENHTKATSSKLPAKSYYELVREVLEDFMTGRELSKDSTDADVWAKQVVADLSTRSPPVTVWRGAMSFMAWFMTSFLPKSAPDGFARQASGMNELTKRLKDQKKQL